MLTASDGPGLLRAQLSRARRQHPSRSHPALPSPLLLSLPPPQGSSAGFVANPLLLTLSPSAYVLKTLSGVRASDLEQALLLLPFASALLLLEYLCQWLREGARTELCCTVATMLVRLHQRQLTGTARAREALHALRGEIRPRLQELKDTMGFNLAGCGVLRRMLDEQAAAASAGLG